MAEEISKPEVAIVMNKFYDRQIYETDSQWEAFRIYRDLGQGRTLDAAYKLYKQDANAKVAAHFRKWCADNKWVSRCKEYDLDCKKNEGVGVGVIEVSTGFTPSHLNDLRELRTKKYTMGNKLLKLAEVFVNRVETQLEKDQGKELAPKDIAQYAKSAILATEAGAALVDHALGIDRILELVDKYENQEEE